MKIARPLLLILAALFCGCSRDFWHRNADANTYGIIKQRIVDPRWAPPRIDLKPDPRSRFYDPYDPNCEPLPPDDPAAHKYMHWMNEPIADGKHKRPWTGGVLFGALQRGPYHGSKSWHQYGVSPSVENPHWLAPFGLSPEQLSYQETMQPPTPPDDPPPAPESLPEQGAPAETSPEIQQTAEQAPAPAPTPPGIQDLTLEQALELAYIHSREYQTQLEDMYLSALALTFERFRFDVRYLGFGGRPESTTTFESVPGVRDSIGTGNRMGISRILPTGGQWVAELANNTLWLFSGGNNSSTASTLSFSLVQPLLLGAGRKVTLEGLTQSERNALYATRDFARFRQQFFVQTVSGGGTSAGAYLQLLQQRQSVLNQQSNIYLLAQQAERLRALAALRPEFMPEQIPNLPDGLVIPPEFDGILQYFPAQNLLRWKGEVRMTAVQMQTLSALSPDPDYKAAIRELFERSNLESSTLEVTQLETTLANSQSQLLQSERAYQDFLDRYKIQLGLPPDLPVSIDTRMLRPFELIDPQLTYLERALKEFVAVWAQLEQENPTVAQLLEVTRGLQALRDRVRVEALELVAEDFKRVEANREKRFANLDEEDRRQIQSNFERDQRLYETYRREFEAIDKTLDELAAALEKPGRPRGDGALAVRNLADLREDLVKVVQNLQVVEISLRVELISLNPFDQTLEEVTRTALENRMDLMNVRAQVMDARRFEEITANQLRSVMNLRLEGDVRTRTLGAGNDNPLAFRGDQSSFRAGVSFVAPLDQVLQRNAYRASLINYQRARRDYMAFEDQVKLDVRQAWRQLTTLRQTFEISRQALRLAALQLDQAVERTTAPVQQGQPAAGGQGNAGNSGLNLLQALNSVLQAQNNLISTWVNYEANRLNIHRDMGIMMINERGVWYDEYYQQRLPATLEEADSSFVPPAAGPELLPDPELPELEMPEPELTDEPTIEPNLPP